MTGWGQDGSVRHGGRPRHQLHRARRGARRTSAGPARPPVPPLNLVGDFGGGGMFLALGVVCRAARGPAQRPGSGRRRGDGRRHGGADDRCSGRCAQSGLFDESRAAPTCSTPAPTSTTSTSAPTAVAISIGSIEPQFYAVLLDALGLDRRPDARQPDGSGGVAGAEGAGGRRSSAPARATSGASDWRRPTSASRRSSRCRRRPSTRTTSLAARSSRSTASTQPAPAPRFSRTPGAIAGPPSPAGAHTREVLADWGLPADRIDALHATGAVASAPSDP